MDELRKAFDAWFNSRHPNGTTVHYKEECWETFQAGAVGQKEHDAVVCDRLALIGVQTISLESPYARQYREAKGSDFAAAHPRVGRGESAIRPYGAGGGVMKALKMEIEVRYDDELWCSDDQSRAWFFMDVLSGALFLRSATADDDIGEVKIITFQELPDGK